MEITTSATMTAKIYPADHHEHHSQAAHQQPQTQPSVPSHVIPASFYRVLPPLVVAPGRFSATATRPVLQSYKHSPLTQLHPLPASCYSCQPSCQPQEAPWSPQSPSLSVVTTPGYFCSPALAPLVPASASASASSPTAANPASSIDVSSSSFGSLDARAARNNSLETGHMARPTDDHLKHPRFQHDHQPGRPHQRLQLPLQEHQLPDQSAEQWPGRLQENSPENKEILMDMAIGVHATKSHSLSASVTAGPLAASVLSSPTRTLLSHDRFHFRSYGDDISEKLKQGWGLNTQLSRPATIATRLTTPQPLSGPSPTPSPTALTAESLTTSSSPLTLQSSTEQPNLPSLRPAHITLPTRSRPSLSGVDLLMQSPPTLTSPPLISPQVHGMVGTIADQPFHLTQARSIMTSNFFPIGSASASGVSALPDPLAESQTLPLLSPQLHPHFRTCDPCAYALERSETGLMCEPPVSPSFENYRYSPSPSTWTADTTGPSQEGDREEVEEGRGYQKRRNSSPARGLPNLKSQCCVFQSPLGVPASHHLPPLHESTALYASVHSRPPRAFLHKVPHISPICDSYSGRYLTHGQYREVQYREPKCLERDEETQTDNAHLMDPITASSVSNVPPLVAPAMTCPVSGRSTMHQLMDGLHICDCCPKKPKKFETPDELTAHLNEKQFGCPYCSNRFKNKNEAERHQNSLHVRPLSWSCSALTGYDLAFYDSINRPGEVDMCGYCGKEFARNGLADPAYTVKHTTEQDWDERVRHLQSVHKFRECNASKKFYRADHFRQHLKHSHGGSSGKWTGLLENACMSHTPMLVVEP